MPDAIKRWFSVSVTVDPDAAEAVESAFSVLDALGTEIDSLRQSKTEPRTVVAFFDEPRDVEDVRAGVEESLKVYGFDESAIRKIETSTVEETDWLAEWKKYWKPTTVGRFVIAPPWESVSQTDKIIIQIEPNMAFGTGTHETTQLCLDAIGRYYDGSQSFLDIGTGTGILSVAAAKLGGTGIQAYDTDADSIKIARENAAGNAVGEQITFFDGSINNETPAADFVAANLTLDVILPILDLLLAKTTSILLLSGILVDQQGQITDALKKQGFDAIEIKHSGEWISVILRK